MPRLWSGTVATGLVAGVVGGLVAPALARSSLWRPTAKAVVRGGILLFEQGRELTARWSEYTSDLVAEVQHERMREALGAGGASQPAGGADRAPPAGHA